ncbi:transposase [Streptomyces sp. NPDC058257]|uniref:transposase n=1 Tax=Streptomyces sp. NPDC058257 TaxID=3346409 RepID=UPI0036E51627
MLAVRARRSFTPEFKAEIVELCRRSDRSIGQVAKDFDPMEVLKRATAFFAKETR